tara:strand:- start:692 stop:988 length:297 start_codon:yes stop_codon:yes gene_type:complete
MTLLQLLKECKEAHNYFIKHNFVEDLCQDEQYYVKELISYYKRTNRYVLNKAKQGKKATFSKNEIMQDAIEYIGYKAEEQTTDNKHYMYSLLTYADNF